MKPWLGSLVSIFMGAAILCIAPVSRALPDTTGSASPDPAAAAAAAVPGKPPGAADTSDYVGAETCKACHQPMFESYEKTPHWKTMNDTRGGPPKPGCEGCHGPGGAHVAGGGDVTKIFTFKNASAKEINGRCLATTPAGRST